MTAKELAQRLDGRETRCVIRTEEKSEIASAGLVVAYGQSDDLLEFDGAIYDEAGAYEGATVYIKNGAVIAPYYDCTDYGECPAWDEYIAQAKTITAVWHDEDGPCWTIETDIPHEEFRIYDDGELFSVGIVFRVEDTLDKPRQLDRSRWEGCHYCADQETVMELDWIYGLEHILPDYKFCPICGRPLAEEAWAELERRIGGNDEKTDR